MGELSPVAAVGPQGRARVAALAGADLKVAGAELRLVRGPIGRGMGTLVPPPGSLGRPSSGQLVVVGEGLSRGDSDRGAGDEVGSFGDGLRASREPTWLARTHCTQGARRTFRGAAMERGWRRIREDLAPGAGPL